jgi:hypothetical protein
VPAPALREIQRLFWHSIADQPGASSLEPKLIEIVEPSAKLDRRGRLRVYADAYFWRLRDVLREDFPKVAGVLGPERFERLVAEYLRSYPSENPSVRHLGRLMAQFLAEHRASGHDDLPPFLSDLARLEWARVEAFDAPDAEAIGAEEMRLIPAERWPELRFYPVPALEVFDAAWPVHRIWDGDAAGESPEPATIMVWRARDFQVLHRAVDQRAADALRALIAHEPFAAICGAFGDLAPGDAARESGALFARWLQDGIIAHTSFAP